MAGQSDSNAVPQRNTIGDVPAPYQSQASWIAGLRDGDGAAIRAFYLMHAPLLRDQARRMSVAPHERDELVTSVLTDVLLHIQESDLAPRDLVRYLVSALRNRARNAHRDRARRDARQECAYADAVAGGQRIVAECHSEYGLRTASAADVDAAPPLGAAIRKLAEHSAQALRPEDATLMIGLSRHVPLRDLAGQAGISYGAARVRVHRLRERFLKLARQYVASLEADERREMERFFRRAGVALHADERPARPPVPRERPTSAARDEGETE